MTASAFVAIAMATGIISGTLMLGVGLRIGAQQSELRYGEELARKDDAIAEMIGRIDRLRAQRDEARARVYEHIDGLSAEYVGSGGES